MQENKTCAEWLMELSPCDQTTNYEMFKYRLRRNNFGKSFWIFAFRCIIGKANHVAK